MTSRILFDASDSYIESPLLLKNQNKFNNCDGLILHARKFVTSGNILELCGDDNFKSGTFGYVTFAYGQANIPSDSPWPSETERLFIEAKRMSDYGSQIVFAYLIPGNISTIKIAIRLAGGLKENYNWSGDWYMIKN